jgi:mutual gliding-motility protein MglA
MLRHEHPRPAATMPLVNHSRKELHLKLVYYGPGLGGKTTNLEYIHGQTKPNNRGKLISLKTEAERTLFFDLLPVDLGSYRGYRVRIHLCTVPGQIALDSTRQLVLRHVDGVVFVVDSQETRIEANVDSIRNLETNLRKQGDDPDVMPLVVQYNKRDLPNAMPVAALRHELNVPDGVREFEASAVSGEGVFATFKTITMECLKLIGDPTRMDEGRSASILPGRRASMYPGALPPSLGSGILPRSPKIPSFNEGD